MNGNQYIHVHLTTDEDSMTGSQGWDGINEKDTVDKFADLVQKAVIEMFPGVEVEVETYAPTQFTDTNIDGSGHGAYAVNVGEEVQEIITRVYSDGEFWINE